ncbi:MAG: hypothetical protein PF694_12405 [Bacteroidetes bacterium]|jgi:endonuclease/exonuclease/phosphatase family metal-dependent hydrolase|nr:hypothetical protein [Bacteroidota bacterium]
MKLLIKSLQFSAIGVMLFFLSSCGTSMKQVKQPQTDWLLAFYNVENLFDTINDPTINDEEFLPGSKLDWNTKKYQKKLQQKARVLAAMDSLEMPHFIGLAEIENREVLEDLIREPAIANAKYSVAHIADDDDRGIEVAALYRSAYFQLLHLQAMEIETADSIKGKMRHILYAKGLIWNNDTLHIFVNHWTSRWGGKEETDPKRRASGDFLRHKADSLLALNEKANIVIMGDLNDNPNDPSIATHLNALSPAQKIVKRNLYNLSLEPFLAGEGTLYYRSWDYFDQVIVSSALLEGNGLYAKQLKVVKHPWMLYQPKEGEARPNRTASGGRYFGGFSDHLPVVLSISNTK